MKIEKKTLIIICVLSALVVFTAIFCAVWYTVPVNVNAKLDKIVSSANTFSTSKLGVGYKISSEDLAQIFDEELKDVKYVNSSGIVESINYLRDSLFLRYGDNDSKYIKIDGDKIFIGVMCYRADKELQTRISHKIFEKAKMILD